MQNPRDIVRRRLATYTRKDYCMEQILESREIIGNKNTTTKEWDAVDRGLARMYVLCPDEIKDIVFATLTESNQRRMMLGKYL